MFSGVNLFTLARGDTALQRHPTLMSNFIRARRERVLTLKVYILIYYIYNKTD